MDIEIKRFSPIDHKIKALVYGPAGAGKTMFAGGAVNALYASAEGGLLSIAEKNPAYVEIKSFNDLERLVKHLKNEKHEYEAIVIDSITEINEIIKTEIEKKVGRNMQLQDWGDLSKKIRDIFRKFRDLPMHVLFIAQEMYINDEQKIKKIVPSMNGKAATEIAYFMDIVGYINVESDGTRWIQTSTDKKLLTKDRTKLIGDDAPLSFNEWVERAKSIKVKQQRVVGRIKDEKENQRPPLSSHLVALMKELQKRGAKDQESGLIILNKTLSRDYKNFEFDGAEASKILIELLQVKQLTN